MVEEKEAGRQEVLNDPSSGYRERLSESGTKAWADPEIRRRRSDATRAGVAAHWADPKRRAETVAKIKAAAERQWSDPAQHVLRSETATEDWATNPRGWVTDGTTTRRIAAGDPIPEGWRVGRAFAPRPGARKKA